MQKLHLKSETDAVTVNLLCVKQIRHAAYALTVSIIHPATHLGTR